MTWADEKSFLERVSAWGGLSYTFGFLIVFVHTFRQGLPVIELLNPVLIMVGVPLTLLAFFATRIVKLLRGGIDATRNELALLKADAAIDPPVYHSDIPRSFPAERVADEAAAAITGPLLRPAAASIIRWWVKTFVAKAASSPEKQEALARGGDRSIRAIRTATAFTYFLKTVILTALILGAVAAYVWTLYPRIPQSAGGGKPALVRLAMKSDAIPDPIRRDLSSDSLSAASKAGSFLTDPVLLLFTGKDAVYLRTNSGQAISIARSGIAGIVWQ